MAGFRSLKKHSSENRKVKAETINDSECCEDADKRESPHRGEKRVVRLKSMIEKQSRSLGNLCAIDSISEEEEKPRPTFFGIHIDETKERILLHV
jgi:hypothetical protein